MPTCSYCGGAIEWIEVGPGQRVPFDPEPEPSPPWAKPSAICSDRRPYVVVRGVARLATDEDRRLLRTMRYRHRCAEYQRAREKP